MSWTTTDLGRAVADGFASDQSGHARFRHLQLTITRLCDAMSASAATFPGRGRWRVGVVRGARSAMLVWARWAPINVEWIGMKTWTVLIKYWLRHGTFAVLCWRPCPRIHIQTHTHTQALTQQTRYLQRCFTVRLIDLISPMGEYSRCASCARQASLFSPFESRRRRRPRPCPPRRSSEVTHARSLPTREGLRSKLGAFWILLPLFSILFLREKHF